MKRGYTALEFKSVVPVCVPCGPNIALTSDFIVGFLGETAKGPRLTMNLIDDVAFDGAFSFVYSARPGTRRADLVDDTPRRKVRAFQPVAEAAGRAVLRLQQAMIGRTDAYWWKACRARAAPNSRAAPKTTVW